MCGASGTSLKQSILQKINIVEYKKFLYSSYQTNPSLEPVIKSLLKLAEFEEENGNTKLAKKYYEMCFFHYPDNKLKYAIDKYGIDKTANTPANKYWMLYKRCLEKINFEDAQKNIEIIINESGDSMLIDLAYKRMYFQIIENKAGGDNALIKYLDKLEEKKVCLDFVYSKRGELKYNSINYTIENAVEDINKLIKIKPKSENYWKFHDIIYRFKNKIKDPFREFSIAKKRSENNTTASKAQKMWQNVEYYYSGGFYDKSYNLAFEIYTKYKNTRPYCAWALDYMSNMLTKKIVLQNLPEDEQIKKWADYTFELITQYPEYINSSGKVLKLFAYYSSIKENKKTVEIKKFFPKFFRK